MRSRQKISDRDYAKLVAILGDKLTRDFAERIIANAALLCGFRKEFGQESRVAKSLRVEGDREIFRMSMFEGKAARFDVEYDPSTEMVTRVL